MKAFLKELKCKQCELAMQNQRLGCNKTETVPTQITTENHELKKSHKFTLTNEDVVLICDYLINNITKKVQLMPISSRFLIKMIANLLENYVKLSIIMLNRTKKLRINSIQEKQSWK